MRLLVSIIFFSLAGLTLPANESINVNFNGYLSAMPSLYLTNDSTLWQAIIHNRLNLALNLNEKTGITAQMRNQVIGGDFIKLMQPEIGLGTGNYFLPFTFKKKIGDKLLLSSELDRLWIDFTLDKLVITIGRQRINWGQTFVWNPNDIFNTYNFFDFDYPERQGSDAIRLQYYTGNTSSLEIAAKLDSAGYFTGGGLFRFTKWNTEFQVLAGYYSNKAYVPTPLKTEDIFTGLGFSTGINIMSIRGEATYLTSVRKNNDSTNQLLLSTTVDFTLAGNLGMMFEFFFNDKIQATSSVFSIYTGSQNIKNLAFTKYNIFAQLSYPFTPIINGTIGGIYFFDDDLSGFYTGPSLEVSLGDNTSLSAIWQLFTFKYQDVADSKWTNMNFGYLRFKWNF